MIWLHIEQGERKTGEELRLFTRGNDCDATRRGGENACCMKVGADCDGGTKTCSEQSRTQTLGECLRRSEQSLGSCNVQYKCACGALTCLLNTRREDRCTLHHDFARGCLAF